MKLPIDDLFKNPIIVVISLITGAILSVFLGQNYASVDYLEKRIGEVKAALVDDNEKIYSQLAEIKSSIKDVDRNIVEIYKVVKYEEGRNERKR